MKFFRRFSENIDMKTVVHQGWLLQIPRKWWLLKWTANYHWRWFILRHIGEGRFVFDYFTDASCLKHKGTLNLFPIKQLKMGLSFGPKDKILVPNNMFVIITDTQEFQLVAETELEVRTWLTCICSFCRFPLKSIKSFKKKRKVDHADNVEHKTLSSEFNESNCNSQKEPNYILLKDCYAGKPAEDHTDSTTIAKTVMGQYNSELILNNEYNSSKKQMFINTSLSSRDLNKPPPKPKTPIITRQHFSGTTPDLRISQYDSPPVPVSVQISLNSSSESISVKNAQRNPSVSQSTSDIVFTDCDIYNTQDSPLKIYSSVYETVPIRSRSETTSTIEKIRQEALNVANELEKAYVDDSGIDSAQSYTIARDFDYEPSKNYYPIDRYEAYFLSMSQEILSDPQLRNDTSREFLNNNRPFTVYDHPIIEMEDSCTHTKSVSSQGSPKQNKHIGDEVDTVDGPLRYNEFTKEIHTESPSILPEEHENRRPDSMYDFPRSYPPLESPYVNTSSRPNIYVNASPGFKTHFDDNSNVSDDLPVGSLENDSQPLSSAYWESGGNNSPRDNVAIHEETPPVPPRSKPKRSSLSGVYSSYYLKNLPPKRPPPRTSRSKIISSSSPSISLSSQPVSPLQVFKRPMTTDEIYFTNEQSHSYDEIQGCIPGASEVSYIDLDLGLPSDDISPTPRKRHTIYNTVDFMKTKGFNETRKNVEEIYKANLSSD